MRSRELVTITLGPPENWDACLPVDSSLDIGTVEQGGYVARIVVGGIELDLYRTRVPGVIEDVLASPYVISHIDPGTDLDGCAHTILLC